MFIQQWHPAAEAFPLMQGEKFQEFVEDIRAHGVLKPIEFYDGERWPEFKGYGIDGRNRQNACALLSLDAPARALTDADIRGSLTSYIASANIWRRHLTSSQRAVVALELERQFADENKDKIKRGQEKGRQAQSKSKTDNPSPQLIAGTDSTSKTDNPSPQLIAETDSAEIMENKNSDAQTTVHFEDSEESSESRQQAAAAVGTNRQYVSDAKIIEKASQKLLDLIRDDKLSIPQAKSVLKQREAHQEAFTALEEAKIDFHQFRDWCFLKGEHADLWNQFRQGRLTAEQAVKTAKERKSVEKKAKDTELHEAVTAASIKKRVETAFKELGDSATIPEIAARAGVSAIVAENIVFGIPDENGTIFGVPASELVLRGEEIGAGADGRLMYLAKEGESTDRLNRPLDVTMVPVFLALQEFDGLIELFGQCQTQLHKLSVRQAAAWVNHRSLIEQLGRFQEHLRENAPYCVCPSCSGAVNRDEHPLKQCPTCHAKGFICKGDFHQMKQDLQEVAKGYKKGD